MAIRFGLSPWGAIGGFAGGLAEGALAGSTIAAQQQRVLLAREQMEQTRLQNALAMLLKGAELEQTMPGMGAQIMTKAGELHPALGGIQSPYAADAGMTPWMALAKRNMAQVDAIIAANPEMAPYRDEMYAQISGFKNFQSAIKPTAEMTLAGVGAGVPFGSKGIAGLSPQQAQAVMAGVAKQKGDITGAQAAARFPFQVDLKLMGGGGRGGGSLKEVKWYDPKTNKFLGWFPRHSPPTPDAVPDRSTEREVAVNIPELKILYDLTESDTKLSPVDKQRKLEVIKRTMEEAGGMGQMMTTPTGVPSRVKSKVKKPPGEAAPVPWGGTDTPPPSGQ